MDNGKLANQIMRLAAIVVKHKIWILLKIYRLQAVDKLHLGLFAFHEFLGSFMVIEVLIFFRIS